MVRIGILRNVSARGKVRSVIEFVEDFRESGQKIILFCSLHEVVDQLKSYFPTAVTVTGRDTQDEKQRAVDSFQNDPNTDIIICSIKAAGVGLTLTASSNVGFVEFPWTYADCEQCEDSAHRIGQKDSVNCGYFLGRNTMQLPERAMTLKRTSSIWWLTFSMIRCDYETIRRFFKVKNKTVGE